MIPATQYVIGTPDCSDACTSFRLLMALRTVCLRVMVGQFVVAEGVSRRSDNGLPGLDSRRCFVYELLLTREKFYEEADYVWRRTGTGPQSSGHGCVRDSTPPLMCRGPSRRWVYCWGMAAAGGAGDMRRRPLRHVSGFSRVPTSFPPGHNLSSPLNTTVLSLSLAFLNPVSLPLRIPVSLPQYPAAAVPAAFSLRYHSADVGLGARHERRHGFAIA